MARERRKGEGRSEEVGGDCGGEGGDEEEFDATKFSSASTTATRFIPGPMPMSGALSSADLCSRLTHRSSSPRRYRT